MKAVLGHFARETDSIRTFWFKPEQRLQYVAGQFVELTLKHPNADDRGEKRWFTLSSAPDDVCGISITTRYAGDAHSSTFKKTLFALKPGAELTVTQAMGDFVLPKDPTIPLIFIAAGIGVTPFHSIFAWLAIQKKQRTIRFVYSVRNEDEIIFQDTFAKAGIHATIIVEKPTDAWGGERGYVSAAQIIGLSEPSSESLFYLSGPEPMIEVLSKDLAAKGIPKRQLVTDFFPGYTEI